MRELPHLRTSAEPIKGVSLPGCFSSEHACSQKTPFLHPKSKLVASSGPFWLTPSLLWESVRIQLKTRNYSVYKVVNWPRGDKQNQWGEGE